MNHVLLLLGVLVALGLAEPALGRRTYPIMGVVIAAYVLYAYHTG